MAKNVVIRDVTYNSVPSVTIPLAAGGGNATFTDTSDATLTSGSQMLAGVTSYDASGAPVTGTIPSKSSSDLTASGATVTVPAGNYTEQATKTIESGEVVPPTSIIGTNCSVTANSSNNNLQLSTSKSVTPVVTTAGYISAGTAGDVTVALNANVTVLESENYTPQRSVQKIINANTYCKGAQYISGDTNLVASNIVAGKTIFGVAGSAQIPVISQDSTTKVLSIS